MRSFIRIALLSVLMLLGAAQFAFSAPYTGGTGPGGFVLANGSTSLQLWLRGDVGVTTSGGLVTNWSDQSGYGHNFTQVSTDNQPGTNTQNGFSVVDFAGGQTTLTEDFMEATAFANSFTSAQLIIASRSDFDGGGPQFGAPHNLGPSSNNHFPWTDGVIYDTFGTNVRHTTGNPTQPLNQFNIYNVLASNPTWTSRINGSQHFTTNTNNTAGGFNPTVSINMEVGRQRDTYDWSGEIGDFVLYDTTLTSAQSIVSENHFSAKYNITIAPAIDHYAGDTGIDYDRAVFGVGDDGTSEVNNAGMEGFGIQVADGSLDSGEWVFAGHAQPANSIVDAPMLVPNSTSKRWDRVWYLDKTETNGFNATLAFDFEDAGLTVPLENVSYQLIYSADSNFADAWDVLGTTWSETNGTVTFDLTSSSLLDGYYTLGFSIFVAPEPGSFMLMLGVLGCGMVRRRKSLKARRNA